METLLKAFDRLVKPASGQILLDGKQISAIPSRKLAQILGLLPQFPVVPEEIVVSDLADRSVDELSGGSPKGMGCPGPGQPWEIIQRI